jgi:chromosome partitioning protein
MNTALFDLDPQASASSWSDKRNRPSPAGVSAQAARLPGLLEEAAAQSADLVIIDSAPMPMQLRCRRPVPPISS